MQSAGHIITMFSHSAGNCTLTQTRQGNERDCGMSDMLLLMAESVENAADHVQLLT